MLKHEKHEKHEKDLEIFVIFAPVWCEVVVKAHRSALVKA